MHWILNLRYGVFFMGKRKDMFVNDTVFSWVWAVYFSSSIRMWKTGGSSASISVSLWPAQESSTRSCPARCSAARRACGSRSTTTWNRYACKWLCQSIWNLKDFEESQAFGSIDICLCLCRGGKWPRRCSAWCWFLLCAGCPFISAAFSRKQSTTKMTPTAVNCSGRHGDTLSKRSEPHIVLPRATSCRPYYKRCPFPRQLPVSDGLHRNQHGIP